MGAGTGAVTPIRTALVEAAGSDTDWLRDQISTRDWEMQALSSFRARLDRAERDAVRLYFELRKMVGPSEATMALAMRALGVSLDIAQKAVGMYREVEHLDEAQQAAMCLEAAQKFYAAQGKRVVVLDDATNGGSHEAQATENGASG